MKLIKLIILSVLMIQCQSRSAIQAESFSEARLNKSHDRIKYRYFKVYKVVDGDTFWVEDTDRRHIKIRLIGMDAPEARSAFNYKKHPFGPVSKAYLSDMILHEEIRLTFDVDSLDRFGRTLAYAYLKNGDFINEVMIRDGYATIMTIPPNIQFEQILYQAQLKARHENLGIWKFIKAE